LGIKLKIRKKEKGWFFTILFHAFLLFIFSNFGLKYKDPPDPSAEVEFEIEAGGPEAANNSKEELEEEEEVEKVEEVEEQEEEKKEEVESEEEEKFQEDYKETIIIPLTKEEEDWIIKKQKIINALRKSKNQDSWKWSPIINTTEKSEGDWYHGKSKGEDGTSFGIKGGSRGAKIPLPKGKKQQGETLDGEIKIRIDITVAPNGDIIKANINVKESTIAYKPHHKRQSEEKAREAIFTPIDESKGNQKGYIIYIFKPN